MTPNKSKVQAMTAAGVTPREIAVALGLSVTRVYQILKELDMQPAAKATSSEASA